MAVRQPLVEAMLQYREQQVYPLHTPGHKGGRGMAEPLKSQLGLPALALDVSLMAELDDIHQPEGCLKEAQELAAKLYGSEACFFAVNGTTEAIHALLLTALNPGELQGEGTQDPVQGHPIPNPRDLDAEPLTQLVEFVVQRVVQGLGAQVAPEAIQPQRRVAQMGHAGRLLLFFQCAVHGRCPGFPPIQ